MAKSVLIFAHSMFKVMVSSHMVVDMLSVLSGSSDAAICPALGCFMIRVAVCVTEGVLCGIGYICIVVSAGYMNFWGCTALVSLGFAKNITVNNPIQFYGYRNIRPHGGCY